jgi:DNA repair protein RadC
LRAGASSLVLSHNHPSGEAKPSRADEILTERIKMGASLFDISVLDHLIITAEGYFSFSDAGLL